MNFDNLKAKNSIIKYVVIGTVALIAIVILSLTFVKLAYNEDDNAYTQIDMSENITTETTTTISDEEIVKSETITSEILNTSSIEENTTLETSIESTTKEPMHIIITDNTSSNKIISEENKVTTTPKITNSNNTTTKNNTNNFKPITTETYMVTTKVPEITTTVTTITETEETSPETSESIVTTISETENTTVITSETTSISDETSISESLITTDETTNSISSETTISETSIINEETSEIIEETETTLDTEEVILKTNEEIAAEVVKGLWGNGNDRKNRLTEAGYDYKVIQALVDEIMNALRPIPPIVNNDSSNSTPNENIDAPMGTTYVKKFSRGTFYAYGGARKGGSGRQLIDCSQGDGTVKGSIASSYLYKNYKYNYNGKRTMVYLEISGYPQMNGYYYLDDSDAGNPEVIDFFYLYNSNCQFQRQGVVSVDCYIVTY